MAAGVDSARPKLLAAVAAYAAEDGSAPQELVDVALCERFGWTWTELDEQDEARVLPAVAAANVMAALSRVQTWLAAAGGGSKVSQPGKTDWAMWKAAQNARKEAR